MTNRSPIVLLNERSNKIPENYKMVKELQQYRKTLNDFGIKKKKSKKEFKIKNVKSEKILTMDNFYNTKNKKSKIQNSKLKELINKTKNKQFNNKNSKKSISRYKSNRMLTLNEIIKPSQTLNTLNKKSISNSLKKHMLKRQCSLNAISSTVPYTFSRKLGKGSYAIVYLGTLIIPSKKKYSI